MARVQVAACDVCGKQYDESELTHSITIQKKGGPSNTKEEVCTACAKAVHDLMIKKGTPKERKPKDASKIGKKRGRKPAAAPEEDPAEG